MLNVLLVEDDILERELIRQSWVWQQGEFNLAAEAGSGLEAWEILKQGNIDIVITDIKMPVMDGLELSKRINTEMPDIKTIILSGYSDFQYARQAISFGVSEYLVKTVKSDDLLEVLRNVAAKLQEESQIYQEAQNYREQMQNNRQNQLQSLLEDLSVGISPVENLSQQAELLNFNLDFQSVCCAIITYLDEKILINESEHLIILESQKVVDAYIKNLDIISFAKNIRETYLIFRNPQLPEVKVTLHNIRACVISQQQKANWPNHPMIALGSFKQGIAGIAESFADARFLLNFQHLISSHDLLFFDEILPIHQSTYKTERALTEVKESIIRALDQGSKSEIKSLVESFISQLQSINMSLIFFQYTYIEIGHIIRHFLLEVGENPDDIFLGQDSIQNMIFSENYQNWANDLPAYGQSLIQTLLAVIDIRNQKRSLQLSDSILKAKLYIDQHYDDPTLNLTVVASAVNLNPSYFSNLFSHKMGTTFTEYLNGIRIEKAKVLLSSSSMSTFEIAFAVGYSNSSYFTKVFKSITSESPRSFKKMN